MGPKRAAPRKRVKDMSKMSSSWAAALEGLEKISSRVTHRDLEAWRQEYDLSPEFELSLVSDGRRAHHGPGVDGLVLYREQLKAGVRFPIDTLLEEVCRVLQVPLTQIHPNSIRTVLGLQEAYRQKGYALTLSRLFQVITPYRRGYSPYIVLGLGRTDACFIGYEESIKPIWREKYFVVTHPSVTYRP